MTQYRYQALDELQRQIAGEVEAETVSQAIAAIEARGLVVQSIVRAPADSSTSGVWTSLAMAASVPSQQVGRTPLPAEPGQYELQSLLTKAFEQGPVAAPMLRAYAQDVLKGGQRKELEQVAHMLEASDLVGAVSGFRGLAQWWLPLLGAMAKATTSGALLDGFVERLGPARERRRPWWLALAYPLLLLGLVLAVLTIISVWVVPTFSEIFDSFESTVPAVTAALLTLAACLQTWWALLLIIVLATCLVLFVPVCMRPMAGRQFVNWALARLPTALTPRKLRSLWIGRFAAHLAHLLEAGAPPSSALRVAALTVERPAFRTAARRLADVIEGASPPHDLSSCECLSATVVYAVQAPVPPHAQIHLLREIGNCQLEQTNTHGRMVAAIGPIAVVLIGLIVGWMMLALFAPLFQLVGDLSG